MKKAKNMALWILAIMFVLCFVIKDIEFLYIKTDSTFIDWCGGLGIGGGILNEYII